MAVTLNDMAEAYIETVKGQLQQAQAQVQQAEAQVQQAKAVVTQLEAHLAECIDQVSAPAEAAPEPESTTTKETIPVNPFQSVTQG